MLQDAAFLLAQGREDECMRLCNEVLNEKFDQPEALFLIGQCLLKAGKTGFAHAVYMHFLQLKPNVASAWNNLGKCYLDMNLLDEAEGCMKRVIKLEPKDSAALCNLGLVHLNRCETKLSIEYSGRALKLNPDSINAQHNLGLAHLMEGNWKEGWPNYASSVGCNVDRKERVYREESRWDGSKGKCVIAYGEQGLGDEISFASCIPDLIKDCSETVIECDSRLEGLFKRSFPQASIHGTRFKEWIDWMDQHDLEGRVAFGTLPMYYRNETKDFPGTPYLVAEPQRRIQWRALLASLGDKPKIGLSWQGGMNKTGKARRSVSLESLLPILRQDATFISLQYKNAEEEIKLMEEKHDIKIHHWPRAVEAKDYDETAALVAELDMVISVTTAVIHLSGSLGIPCLVLTPKNPMWRYGLTEETMPWYKSVTIIRQKNASDWLDPIHECALRLRNFINGKHYGDHELHGVDGRSRRVA